MQDLVCAKSPWFSHRYTLRDIKLPVRGIKLSTRTRKAPMNYEEDKSLGLKPSGLFKGRDACNDAIQELYHLPDPLRIFYCVKVTATKPLISTP